VQETRDALTAFQKEQQRMTALDAAASAARTAADLADDRYKNGLAGFEPVLEAQRAQLTFEDQLVQSRSAVTQNLIQLYKVLGGGWTSLDR
jgi:outer membrane protein TolC